MTHAFDPQPTPSSTAEIPVMPPVETRRYNAVPPERIAGKQKADSKGLSAGAIVAIVIGAIVVVAIIALLLFFFVFNHAETCTVSFETGGGSTIETEQVEQGEAINSPADPKRDGYGFDGWYSDPDFSTPVTFPLSPESDVTLYAKWVPMEGATSADAGSTSETYSTDDQARSALKGYLSSLEKANDVVHDFATNDFNKKIGKGQSELLDCMDNCQKAQQDVYSLLASGSGTQWKVSTMTLPTTYSEERAMLEEASDMLITRLNAYYSALQVIDNMGTNVSDDEIGTAIESYLNDGHVAYENYKDLVAKLKKSL